jgi:hypothetical protein
MGWAYMDLVLGPTVGGYWLSVGAYVVVHVGPTEGNILYNYRMVIFILITFV